MEQHFSFFGLFQWPFDLGTSAFLTCLFGLSSLTLLGAIFYIGKRHEHQTQEVDALKHKIWNLEVTRSAAQRQNEDLRENLNHRSQLLGTMSHELRTPLNGMIGLADLLSRSPLDPQQSAFVDAIGTCGVSLSALIDEILDFLSVEAGKDKKTSSVIDLPELLESIVELMAPQAHGKGLDIALLTRPDTPRKIEVDALRLRQILLNLIGNAVKYTSAGGIGVEVWVESNMLNIAVHDTGKGISQEMRGKLFEPFERGGGMSENGSGLGLSIAGKVATGLGGSLSLQESSDKGSTFILKLPVKQVEAAKKSKKDRTPAPIGRGLVIAQSGFLRAYLCAMAAKMGLYLAEASGEEDLRGLDFLFVDNALGAERAKAVAARARAAGVRKIVILVSPFERQSPDLADAQLFDAWLVKPIRQTSLNRLLRGTLEKSVQKPEEKPLAAQLTGQIVLVEDNEINRLVATHQLQSLGLDVLHAENGVSALRIFDQAEPSDEVRPLAILMDLYLPDMRGDGVAKAIRQQQKNPPAIFLMTSATQVDEDIRAQFDGNVHKPLDLDEIRHLWQTLETRKVA